MGIPMRFDKNKVKTNSLVKVKTNILMGMIKRTFLKPKLKNNI